MKKNDIIFLYAGQGSQREGMGRDFYEAYPAFRKMIDSLELTIKEKSIKEWLMKGTMEELSDTSLTQPCMSAFAAGVTAILKEKGIEPAGACGLSLGEYGALHAAGVFDAVTYVNLTAFRGKHMAEASSAVDFGMRAVLGLDFPVIEEACHLAGEAGYVKLVNYNCPGQYVIGGEEKAVQKAEEILKEKGGKRFIPLKVSGPFHTKFMEPAAKKLGIYLENIEFKSPRILVAANATGEFIKPEDDIKDLLTRQIQNSVYFEQNIKQFLEKGYTEFIEIGPGSTLSSFVKKIAKACDRKASVVSIDKLSDLEQLCYCSCLSQREVFS